jgi:hypothetical protein
LVEAGQYRTPRANGQAQWRIVPVSNGFKIEDAWS